MISIILLFIFISEINGDGIKRVEEIGYNGVRDVKFDVLGNIYVVAGSDDFYSDRLYKLNATNNVLFGIDLPDYEVIQMLVSNRGDTYLTIKTDYVDPGKGLTLIMVPTNSTEIKFLGVVQRSGLLHLDSNDNVFYCKERGSVHVLRPSSLLSVLVNNLGTCNSVEYNKTTSDKSGNTYFVTRLNDKYSVVLVSNEALQGATPNATVVYVSEQSVNGLMVDEKQNFWIIPSGQHSISKLENGILKTIRTENCRRYLKMMRSKGRTYVIAEDRYNFGAFYITDSDDFLDLPKVQNVVFRKGDYIKTTKELEGLANSGDIVYFYTSGDFKFDESSDRLLSVVSGEKEAASMLFRPEGNKEIYFVALDCNDGLWIFMESKDPVMKDIYFLRKGEFYFHYRTELRTDCYRPYHVHFSPVAEKIYFFCPHGLFSLDARKNKNNGL